MQFPVSPECSQDDSTCSFFDIGKERLVDTEIQLVEDIGISRDERGCEEEAIDKIHLIRLYLLKNFKRLDFINFLN